MKFKPTDKEGIFKSLFAAYFVLLLHVALVAGAGVTVVLFKGVYEYLPWIMGGLAALVIALFWVFYIRIKHSSSDIKDVLAHPAFQNRNVEIKLLGGVATFKLSASDEKLLPANERPLIGTDHGYGVHQLESGHTGIERRLSELASLYKRDLIDEQEYEIAKKRILFESDALFISSGTQVINPQDDQSGNHISSRDGIQQGSNNFQSSHDSSHH